MNPRHCVRPARQVSRLLLQTTNHRSQREAKGSTESAEPAEGTRRARRNLAVQPRAGRFSSASSCLSEIRNSPPAGLAGANGLGGTVVD